MELETQVEEWAVCEKTALMEQDLKKTLDQKAELDLLVQQLDWIKQANKLYNQAKQTYENNLASDSLLEKCAIINQNILDSLKDLEKHSEELDKASALYHIIY